MDFASPVFAQLLWNRAIRSPEAAERFLHPSWDQHTHSASQFLHMPQAVARVFLALEQGERITIHGDYDADGVTGSAVLITTLRELLRHLQSKAPANADLVDYYIPHRDQEGYGLHAETVRLLHERGTTLLVTVDCGIACNEEIALAKTLGMDTIVVDHHQFGETLPDAHIIHPSVPNEPYPFKHLAAVGVAFKFACELVEEGRRKGLALAVGWEKWLLDLVAIATVTDMVPLVDENRVLETYGLTVLNKTRRHGLRALIRAASLEGKTLTSESIGFGLGPRLNAAGRMDHASLALRLLLAETEEEAVTLAAEVERHNRARQDTTRRMMVEAEEKMQGDALQATPLFVHWDERWAPALVGLVAGKFLERFGKPAIAIGQHNGTWIGSGRSHAGFDVTEAVRVAGEGLLVRVGGHKQACGFTLASPEHLTTFQERLVAYTKEHLNAEEAVPTLEIDAELSLDAVEWPLMDELAQLMPYGQSNPQPLFFSRASVLSSDVMGKTQSHLRLTVKRPDGRWMKFVGFSMGAHAATIKPGDMIGIVYHLEVNDFREEQTIEGRIHDLGPASVT